MSGHSTNPFSKEIQPYLIEIASRLWSGHATVMVGAGFSKNAINNDPTKAGFPSWFELGNILYEKIHGHMPESDQHYLNLLKLAEEVQAAFGRAVLDQLIKDHLPDKDHYPSELHIKLLGLPWSDIFTTNYDTLLERASEHVFTQKYDLVINKEDLIYARRPRIIKLHGSFPSERPLIVTEEDYRSYPRLFAPFVNTVQQSLIENTLCLIGFSGDDPNFIQWIGWIMDNLGKENSPKIYLVGMINMSHAQRKLLESKNIVIVNLNPPDGHSSHYQGLLDFVNYLYNEKKKDQYIDWPSRKHFDLKKDSQVPAMISHWKKERLEYPNWLILPYAQRERLWEETSRRMLREDDFSKLESPFDIEYLYEFNWRLEVALSTLLDEQLETMEQVLNKYQILFLDPTKAEDLLSGRKVSEVKGWWLRLGLGLLRFYRHEAHNEKWIAMNKSLLEKYPYMSADLQARYHYEVCLHTIFSLNFSQLQTDLDNWPVNETLPYWEAKRAGLMAEGGNLAEAKKILERSLTRIRQRLNLSPVVNDYTWVSQEAYVMQLINFIQRNNYGSLGDEDGANFKERWNILKLYKCDPWQEIEVFELKLKRDPVEEAEVSTSYGFDLGSKSINRRIGLTGKETNNGYNYLRYLEETGIPFRLPDMTWSKGALSGAIERIKPYSAYWAMTALIRSGGVSTAKDILTRAFIQQLSSDDVTNLINYFLEMTISILAEFENGSQAEQSGLHPHLPYLLSVLVVKASPVDKTRVIDVFVRLYQSSELAKFTGIKELTKRLLASMIETEKAAFICKLLELPFTEAMREIDELPDPMSMLKLRTPAVSTINIKIRPQLIAKLLVEAKKSSPNRAKAISRLCQLLTFKLLNQQQIKRFTKVLYEQVDNHGFPEGTNYRLFSFVNLPSPDWVDSNKIFKTYILNSEIPTQSKQNSKGTSLTRGKIPLLSEMLDGTKTKFSKYGVTWSNEECMLLLQKLIEWWNADKAYLKSKESRSVFGSIPEEFHQRFVHLPKLLSQVISINNFWYENQQAQQQIKNLAFELIENGFPCLNLKLAFLRLFEQEQKHLFKQISDALVEGEHDKVLDAVNTIIDMTINPFITSVYKAEYSQLIDLVIQQIKWRNFTWFEFAVDTILVVLNYLPEILNDSQRIELEVGLTQLFKETDHDNEELRTDPRLVYRKKSIQLARKLYDYYTEENAPDVYQRWKTVSESLEEFWEIRKQWY